MEEERVVDSTHQNSSSLPTGLPINWGLITGPVPEPVFPSPSLSARLPPSLPVPQSSAVHALQTKVKSLTQRRARGRDREKLDSDATESSPAGQISPEVLFRPRPRGKGQVPLPAPSWRSGTAKILSSSDEEEEVEVQVRLEIHSPPPGAKGEELIHGGEETEEERSDRNESQVSFRPYGLGEGTSLESLLSDNSSSSKDEPSPPVPALPPPPALSSSPATTTSTSTRRWAPPKGFWRVARPETLLLNGVGPNDLPSTLPLKDYTKTESWTEPQRTFEPDDSGTKSDAGISVDDCVVSTEATHLDSVECFLDRCEQKETEAFGLCFSDNLESMATQVRVLSADEKLKMKQRAYERLRERKQTSMGERKQSVGESAGDNEDTVYTEDCTAPDAGVHGGSDSSDSAILVQDLEPYLRSLLSISDELPLSPRHEQAKRLLERARLKARSNHVKGDRPIRRPHSDQRSTVKKQPAEFPEPTAVQEPVQTKEDPTPQAASVPLLVLDQRDSPPGDNGGRSRRYGYSPTRVRFEDESEKEAESRYLDRVRLRGRPGAPRFKSKESNTDSSSSGSERSRCNRSVSMAPAPKPEEVVASAEPTTVIKEIIVLVKKCEQCGSVVREPQQITSPPDLQKLELQRQGNPEDPRGGKGAPHWVPPSKQEVNTRPKAPLTVTFAGAFVLGESKENGTGWKSSGFGKLRRRSRKGESRIESGNGPYGPSWAQRRNSNPRSRVNFSRAVSFAPTSPMVLEPPLLEASGGLREPPAPPLPIKSALKSSSRSRSIAGQSTVQFQITSEQGEEAGSQHLALQDSAETRREPPVSLPQGTTTASSLVPCIRPSTLRYSPARIPTDLPSAELWDATPDGTVSVGGGDSTPGPECRPLRGLALSRAEDLRAELLRAEHLKSEAASEDNCDGSRKMDGRPKLFLRRFFSSIGLNSVGRLVKGGRSSSMEQLSIPAAPRASSASPSPTRRPLPPSRIQRTPSLQTLHPVLPLAQLRKASSVQSLERRTERSTILGEVQIPYGLAPSPDSPQIELHRALSVEDVLSSRMVRPVGRVSQAFPDGTLLLELVRPPNGPFGFVISRGKGRPDTGVYVEKVGDGSGEGPYIGLLGIGDEILQVNGEVVAGLTLDQVTRLMTRESIASLRIMPARRVQR
ncbi:uncharacterized protein LOC141804697 [Halichoeres trimaculatus]|uniref:uncharacterized protein LOC141804697 n=1 Tax=Halichoeres trimaculatus TaxID=147232 RepID=UPI003D9EC761